MKKLIKIILLFTCCCLVSCVYVPTVKQGNIIDPSAVHKIQYGMNKQQVRTILGNPILVDKFNKDYWAYVHTKQINGGRITQQHLYLYFRQNKLTKINGKPKPLTTKGPVSL